ncbi:MAG: hypothetical protein K6T59_10055 [Bryobacteraceae bacterium]|jgi:hypothetical protein|nr:hypothetical protein [Bryobacteraceae bacterium]
MLATTAKKPDPKQWKGRVYCYICTHTVEARILQRGRRFVVKPGQKCPRCGSSLDAAGVVQLDEAA